MKTFVEIAAILIFAATSFAAELPLPQWQGKERQELEAAGWVPGALLLSDDPILNENPESASEPIELEQPKPEEIADDFVFSPEIADHYLPAYFAKRPTSFLIDPQGLLSPTDFRDRLSFLNYHASDSSIDLFVYVIDGVQEIPSEVREEETIERLFSEGRPAAVVYYYLGAPQRSALYLSPSITDEVSAAEQHRALESSVMQAFEKTNAPEQFERFLVQMSIRIYWMERMLAGQSVTAESQANEIPLVKTTKVEAEASSHWIWVQQVVGQYFLPGVVTFGAILTALGFRYWLRLRGRYRFPDFEVEPRLGGPHAAGVGAVISFASAAVPPASQRDQVPDYLRRA